MSLPAGGQSDRAVEFSTRWRWLAVSVLILSVAGRAGAGGGHNRRPYPPLRTATGQASASASASASAPEVRGQLPPLRSAASGPTPPLILDGKSYLQIGKGELKLSSQPQYQLGMYVEHVGARAQFGSLLTRAPTRAMLMSESRAQYFVIWGRFAKLFQLRMLKPASKAELTGLFQSGMPEVFADRAPSELRQDAEALVKLIDRDLAEGQELRIHISEQAQIDLYLDGQKKAGPVNPKLARHLIEIWLGYHSAARVLRQVLVDKIEVLKTPVSKPAK